MERTEGFTTLAGMRAVARWTARPRLVSAPGAELAWAAAARRRRSVRQTVKLLAFVQVVFMISAGALPGHFRLFALMPAALLLFGGMFNGLVALVAAMDRRAEKAAAPAPAAVPAATQEPAPQMVPARQIA